MIIAGLGFVAISKRRGFMTKKKHIHEQMENIRPEKDCAKVLIRLLPSQSEEEVRKALDKIGIHVLETQYVADQFIILKLDTKDVRPVIFSLAASGFTEIKGFSAMPL